jgi:hypothetical protein
MDGGDDLLGIDALEVDRGRAEVGVTELALDDVERDALPCQLERVRVAELMGRETTANACIGGEAAKLDPDPGGVRRPTSGRAVDHAEERADR